MKISPISYANRQMMVKKSNGLRKNTDVQQTTQPSFKGAKGAAVGAVAGLGYLAAMSVIAAPFLPITLGFAALAAGSGAIAGHNIEDDWKEDNNSKK